MGVHSPPKRYRTFGPLWLVVTGLVCLVGAGALLANVVGFLNHSSRKGAQAIAQIETRVEPNSSTSQSNTVSCVGAQGLLEIPAIHLLAPVEPGTLQSTLAYAVGHVSVSPEPGQVGTAVFAAHDVTWFHRISSLSPGDTILYYSACQVLKYVVTAHEVVGHSYAIPNLPAGLALFTCWPLDALWETSQRYVVQATLVGGYRSTRVPKLTTANPSYTRLRSGSTRFARHSRSQSHPFGRPLGNRTRSRQLFQLSSSARCLSSSTRCVLCATSCFRRPVTCTAKLLLC